MLAAIKSIWFNVAAFSLLFITVILFAYTGQYYFLVMPFAFLYVVLLGVNWKAAYWLFLFTIPLSTQINFAGDTASITLPDQPMMWLFLGMFLLILARDPGIIPRWWLQDSLVFVVVLQFIWTIVAVVFSKMLFFSVKFLLVKTWLLVCFFVLPIYIFTEKKDLVKGFLIMMVPMLFTVIVIIIHHYFLGFKFAKVEKSISGFYYNHVDYSTVLSMFLPFLLIAWPLTKNKTWAARGALLLIILIFIAGIGFSQARAAWLAVPFALIVAIAIRMKLVNLIMPTIYALIIALVCYMVPNNKYLQYRPDYNNTYMHKTLADHLLATIRGTDMSARERVYRWIAAVRMSEDRPITGYGPRSFYYFYKPYAVTSFRTYVSRNPEHSTTHNYFLYMLVEQGWPAMLLYALLMYVIFAKAQKVYHRFKDKFYRLCTLGCATAIAAGFINNFFSELLETHKVAALFYIPLALLVILDRKSRNEEASGQTSDILIAE